MTADLVAWLTQIWDEEERLASDDLTPGPWTLEYDCPEGEHHHDWDEAWVSGWHGATVGTFNERYTSGPRDAAHVVRQQPSVVLARIAADRSIRARYERACLRADDLGEDEQVRYEWGVIASTYEEVLCELATAHASRPGFSSKWLGERELTRHDQPGA